MPIDYDFDATRYDPQQSLEAHPKGKFPAQITGTSIVPTKNNDGGMFVVEFTTQAGVISNRYNLWNQEPKAVEIAHKQLAALCYASGIFHVRMANDGKELIGGRLMIEVDDQKNKDGTPNGYVHVKRVLDANGNEPRKAQPAPGQQQMPFQQPQQQAAPQNQPPMQQNGSGGWGAPPATGNAPFAPATSNSSAPPWAK